MKLTRKDLWSLEDYSEQRDTFRREVINHKKDRQISIGNHAVLYFEDAMTMKYQVQEMLRVEKIFTAAEIAEELAAYNPMIPDGTNWKATFMLEYPDVEERRIALTKMVGIEHKVWVNIGHQGKFFAIANEDMERSNDEKTAAVHFLRFELDANAVASVHAGEPITIGIDHAEVPNEALVSSATHKSISLDLD